ncbi:DJ-1/PfpI family protein [Montanilutibacter psychrotolerans]|uniref:Transcriptional regulator n=1 Tax=Montanilutibacter psychrotolerans TaxID=1327343 RepID=A0A3M8SZM7_9GAMM|nr:DJ-1/PfpI family protein [Lysobacter psychrotolerans]RNF86223.1 transcriptional regulator [Lysobacter psychrotolerans]
MSEFNRFLPTLAAIVAAAGLVFAPPSAAFAQSASQTAASGEIAPYHARFDRGRPVVAVIGENTGTELTDFVIPYGVLRQSQAVDAFAISTRPGLLKLRPALQIQPDATIEEFDARFPDGADYVIVPAIIKRDDPALLTWIRAQSAKGGSIVSICDGALVVANAGLMKQHRATGHWATHKLRSNTYPDTQWLTNVRYVADGNIVSSAGISAAIPTSLALVEAIAGHDRAAAVAEQLGVAAWDTQHDSARFHPRIGNLRSFAAPLANRWFHRMEHVGVPIAPGVDEIAVALTADAYSRTGRSHALTVSATREPLRTRNGLTVVPDTVTGELPGVDRVLPEFDAIPSARMLDEALAGIARRYGRATARGVALQFEYSIKH